MKELAQDNWLVMKHLSHSCLMGLTVALLTLFLGGCVGISGVPQEPMPFTSAEAALGQSTTADPTISNKTLLDGGLSITAPRSK